ncbi:MAG: c-type cytochrome [Anaerolinea sp.]|nr:c-type cytochrome [Anaerolinea sp.]
MIFVLPGGLGLVWLVFLALASRTQAGAGSTAFLPLIFSPLNYDILLDGAAFTPHVLAVETGTAVTWKNGESTPQSITAGWGAFNSPELPPHGLFNWPANTPGIYTYTTAADSSIEGALVVSENGAADWFNGRTPAQAYADSCAGCHGADRAGGIGPALLPGALTENDAFYVDTIKNGRPGTIMPGWGNLGLRDEEIWLLFGYLRTEPEGADVLWTMADIQASHTILIDESTLPITPTHSGNLDNLMLVTEREAERIAVFDGDTHTLLGRINTSYRAHGYAFDPTNDRWAYNIGRDGWLFKMDLYTLQPVTKVRVGLDSRGLAISDDGHYLIAGNFAPYTAVILDAHTLQPLKVIDTEGYDPDGRWVQSRVAITSDVAPGLVGPYFIIALKEAGQVWRIDFSQPDFPITKLTNVGRILHDGFLSPDNGRFYLASQEDNSMAVIDVTNWTLVAQIATGDTPHPGSGAVWEANGQTYGATTHAGEGLVTIWNLADNQIAAQIPTSGPGLFIRAHEQNPYIWADTMFASSPNQIYVIDKETFTVTHVITDGLMTLHPELTNDGQFVYISDWQGEVVRVYNAQTFALVAELPDLITPTGIFNTSRRYEMLGH